MNVEKKPTGAYDAAVPLPAANGAKVFAQAMVAVGADGSPLNGNAYQLADDQTIAANAGTAAAPNIQGGSYILDAQFTGTSVKLQSLGSDGETWRDVTTLNTSGTVGVVVGQNATVRLYNPNSGALSSVFASLS